MTKRIDDHDLDAVLRAADPVDATQLHRATESLAATHLRAAVARQGREATRARGSSARRRVALLAGTVAAAVAVPVALTLAHPSSSGSAYAAPLVRFAQNSPLLLVGADGWAVTGAEERSERNGEMTFGAGAARLEVFWEPESADSASDELDLTAAGTAVIDGTQATVGYYPGDRPEFEALWSVDGQTREARGMFADRAAFLAVAQTLHRVDVDTWLSEMPAGVINPGDEAATVAQMLADIPQPRGFDSAALSGSGLTTDRYYVGSRVTGAVTCAWLRQWADGTPAERSAAAAAMATSHGWAVLQEMQREGDYPHTVWMIADAMNGTPFPRTPGTTLEQWSRPALGC